jgi:pimeloyl-ACP methyl ester carboxylesterase
MRHLSRDFTAIAPDMPGYGASDPTGGPPTLPELADHVAAFMEELRIGEAAVYGYHTGASLATSLAARHPARVRVAICEGLLCLDTQERGAFAARYLEPFVAREDGGHLAWLWTRLKDQSLFFPWHERTAAARLDLDATPPAVLESTARDWLRCGEHYWHGYAAAFAYDPAADLAAIRTPHHILCRHGDPVAAHERRLHPLAANVTVHVVDTAEEGRDRVLGILAGGSPGAPAPRPAPRPAPPRPIEGGVWRDYVVSQGTQLQVSCAGPASDPHATLVQHDAGSSLRACAELVSGWGGRGRTLALELPGHGDTEWPDAAEVGSIQGLANLAKDALEVLGVGTCDLVGIGAGAAVQVELARNSPRIAASLTLVAPLDATGDEDFQSRLAASYAPLLGDAHGGYLLQAWHEVRDHLLFFPWYERRRRYAVSDSPRLDPRFLQSRTADLILAGAAGRAVRRAEVGYPLLTRLRELPLTPRFAAPPWEPRYQHVRGLAGARGHFLTLARDVRDWPRQIAEEGQ